MSQKGDEAESASPKAHAVVSLEGAASGRPTEGVEAAAPGAAQAPAAPGAAPAQLVTLRVQVATKAQARVLTWSVILLNLIFVFVAISLFAIRNEGVITGYDLQRLYRGELIIGAICLGTLVFVAAWFTYKVRRAIREQCTWTVRQRYFARTAAVMLILQLCYTACYVAAFAITLAEPNCGFPWTGLAGTDFMQWTFFSALLFFLLARLQNMRLWRGPGALDMPPDLRLQMDRPIGDQMKSQRIIIILWCLLEAAATVRLVGKIRRHADQDEPVFQSNCDVNLVQEGCSPSATQITVACISFAILVGIIYAWVRTLRRSLKDHEQLPYTRYKSTHIYVRVQSRIITPVLTSVMFSLLFMSIIPTFSSACGSAADAQVGNMAVCMALTLAAVVMAILYMPISGRLDSPLLQEFLQEFSWTEASMAADVARRDERLIAVVGKVHLTAGEKAEAAVANAVAYLPGKAMAGIAKVAGVQTADAAAEQLHQEPMFCMETALHLFYWARLAYRTEPELDDVHVNATHALSLFNLDKLDLVWDDMTDTHCTIGWSDTQVVLAFRGTKSLENVLTDIKAYAVVCPPPHRHRGKLVKVHAGFSNAWLHQGFNEKVLARLRALDEARPEGSAPLRFWITGHSLGGALAVLASREIAQQFPNSKLTVYTLGAPRVGNTAFAKEQEEAVPDTWAILNGTDPIPWIPKWGFKRSGKRVTIDSQGNLILRPSYFELSVMERGTSAKHHLTSSYALSIAAVLRAQFLESKAFPGGPEGVAALAAAVDIGASLALRNVDLESLKDPQKLPVSAEAEESKAPKTGASSGGLCGGSRGAAGLCGSLGCGGWVRGKGGEQQQQGAGEQQQQGAGEQQQQGAAEAAGALPAVGEDNGAEERRPAAAPSSH